MARVPRHGVCQVLTRTRTDRLSRQSQDTFVKIARNPGLLKQWQGRLIVTDELAVLDDHTPAAVILDIGLKDGVGGGVANLLVAINIPLIVCSGSAPQEVADIYAQAVWLAKPFEPERLVDGVENLLLRDEFLKEVELNA